MRAGCLEDNRGCLLYTSYGLPKLKVDLTDRLTRSFINKQWLDNLGLSMPTSIDEYYDVLVAFKEQDANGNGDPDDEIPLLFTSDSGGYTLSLIHI